MPTDDPRRPTRTSGPTRSPQTSEDRPAPRRPPPSEEPPRRGRGDETGEHADRMPKGADEPGAGL